MGFKSGDKVKLYNWKDAHGRWSVYCRSQDRICRHGEIYGIKKSSYDKFRKFDDLVIIDEYHKTKVYLVKGNHNNIMWYIPECCLYRQKVETNEQIH